MCRIELQIACGLDAVAEILQLSSLSVLTPFASEFLDEFSFHFALRDSAVETSDVAGLCKLSCLLCDRFTPIRAFADAQLPVEEHAGRVRFRQFVAADGE